jgi:hypothetical protein
MNINRFKPGDWEDAFSVIATRDGMSYYNLILGQGNLAKERWTLTRDPGDYLWSYFSAADPLAAFHSFVAAFALTFEIGGSDEGNAHGPTMWLHRKESYFYIAYHAGVEKELQTLIDATPKAAHESRVHWWFSDSDGDPECAELPLTGLDPHPAFYPWFPKPLAAFAQEFIKSTANVLLLIGPPGTGKTSFIRGLVRNMQYETWVTYDKGVQKSEQFYVKFGTVGNDGGRCLVMEDADEMIGKRRDGNELMNRILNISDGLVTLPARKLIFSTNLPGLTDIDEALLRPGRCFAAIRFRKLTRSEATKACEAIGVKLESPEERLTLSQALNNDQDTLQVQQIGFGPG